MEVAEAWHFFFFKLTILKSITYPHRDVIGDNETANP